ncbi:MAG: 50S ribosomal protein L22 [Blastocatellia bacterium]|nr:50S ribosomal protein L22 [Blastocatellia bacterium]
MEAIAKTKYLKGSPRKARLVIDLIRGQNVSRALSILKFTEKRAAGPIAKCLSSAIANATYIAEQQNIAIDPDDLWIRQCFVDMGPHKNRRRVRPAPQGRAYREQRHYCHITIEVTSDEKAKTEKELKAEAARAKRAEAKKDEAPKKAKAAKKDEKKETSAKAENTADEPQENVEAAAPVEADATAEAPVVETEETAAAEAAPVDEATTADDAAADSSDAEADASEEKES